MPKWQSSKTDGFWEMSSYYLLQELAGLISQGGHVNHGQAELNTAVSWSWSLCIWPSLLYFLSPSFHFPSRLLYKCRLRFPRPRLVVCNGLLKLGHKLLAPAVRNGICSGGSVQEVAGLHLSLRILPCMRSTSVFWRNKMQIRQCTHF